MLPTKAGGDDARISMGSGIAYSASYRNFYGPSLLKVTSGSRGNPAVSNVPSNRVSLTNCRVGNQSDKDHMISRQAAR